MSKVLGIIAEYNPFHNGHLYHLEKAKKDTSSKYTIAIMSGNFTQRRKYLYNLPTVYAISSAENFADGAVKILNSMKIVDYLSFGTETQDYNSLDKIATILYNEPREYKNILQHELKKGLSFPKARQNALMMYLNDIRNYAKLLSSPNNILGIEYIKALKKYNSNIVPYPIQRFESEYHSNKINGNIASSTAIRNIIKNDNLPILRKLMPDSSFSILIDNLKTGHIVPDLSTFEKIIIHNLRKMSIDEIHMLPDVSEGLENSIKNAANSCNNIIDFLNIIKSKRYTSTRLQRILLYSLLNITKKEMDISKKITPYIRVLGFNNKGKLLISEIARANPKLDIITSVKKYIDISNNKNNKILLEKDIWATNVYTIGYEDDSWSNLDYTHKIINIERVIINYF